MLTQRTLPAQKTIALVAHDNRKPALLAWCQQHEAILKSHRLFATGTTGHTIEKHTSLKIDKLISGPLGGDQQIGAGIAEHRIHMLIFFWDPMASQPHDPDIKALLRIAAVWNIPVACTESTADMLVSSPLFTKEHQRVIPDYQQYLAQRT